jgi:hypothetical protein
MSVFGKIKDAIFGRHAEAAENPTGGQPGVNGSPAGAAPVPQTTPASAPAAPTQTAGAPSQGAPTTAAPASVDVGAIMDKAVKAHGQKLDWRHSIVDMMKALDLDSSLPERKDLARELGYDGDTDDSARMNVWLHKALMRKLAENGGKVPAELTD